MTSEYGRSTIGFFCNSHRRASDSLSLCDDCLVTEAYRLHLIIDGLLVLFSFWHKAPTIYPGCLSNMDGPNGDCETTKIRGLSDSLIFLCDATEENGLLMKLERLVCQVPAALVVGLYSQADKLLRNS